jgi:hypothetical protein
MLQVSGATYDPIGRIDDEEMPGLFIGWLYMAAVRSQIALGNSAILQINPAPQPLHIGQ